MGYGQLIAVLLVLFLAGCSTEPGGSTDEVDAGTDTESAENDVDDGGGLDAIEDPAGLTVELRYGGEISADWRIAAFLTHYEEDEQAIPGTGGIFPVIAGEYVSTELNSEEVTLTIPEPAGEDFGEIIEGAQGAGWLIAVYEDVDGDQSRGEDEPIVAISTTLIIYPAEDIETDAGVFPGEDWTALDTEHGVDWLVVDLNQPLEVDPLPMRTTVTVAGTIEEMMLAGLTHMSSVLLRGEMIITENSPIHQPLTQTSWEFSLDGQPHEDRHLAMDSPVGLPLYAERPVVFEAFDGEGTLEETDQIRGYACHDERMAALTYLEEILDPAQALMARFMGISRGWTPVVFVDGYALTPLEEEQWNEVYFDPDFMGCDTVF